MWRFSAAAVQVCSGPDTEKNLAACAAQVQHAAKAGAKFVVLPENFAYLGPDLNRPREEVATGPISRWLAAQAKDNGVWLVGGGMPEAAPSGKAYNSAVAMNPTGELVTTYRKIHLFDAVIPGRAMLTESDHTERGTEVVSFAAEQATVGLSICYDVRFAELYRRLRITHGADVILVPAAFTAHTGAAHWHTLLRARAIENQAYVIAAAQWGRHSETRESFGHSVIYDPWGELLAELPSGDGFVMTELDSETVARVRRQMPCGEHAVLMK